MADNRKYAIECIDCYGEGTVDSTYPVCFKPASECCGGCYEQVECPTCNGNLEIVPDDEDVDLFMMILSLEKMVKGYTELRTEVRSEFRKWKAHVSEDSMQEMESIEFYNQYEDIKKELTAVIIRVYKQLHNLYEEVFKKYID